MKLSDCKIGVVVRDKSVKEDEDEFRSKWCGYSSIGHIIGLGLNVMNQVVIRVQFASNATDNSNIYTIHPENLEEVK